MTFTLAQVLSRQEWIVAAVAAVIVLAVAAIGFQDVGRFSFRRVRAIAGVSFREAMRRRVLYVTPLAMVGVIAVSQLTLPFDEQDAIRQTTRYCLFAAGMIVVLTALLLAATNLPKEIESRVIFTIVTKPTTRLEIVLGKVLGFSLVSGMILLIMGLFTFGYLQVRAWAMVKNVKAELARIDAEESSRPPPPSIGRAAAGTRPATGPATQASPGDEFSPESEAAAAAAATELNQRIRKQTLRRYAEGGLLGTKAIAQPTDFQIYARDPGPDAGPNTVRWIGGGQQLYVVAPLNITDADREKIQSLLAQNRPPYLVVRLAVEQQKNPLPDELRELEQGGHPLEAEVFGPMTATAKGTYKPQITVIAHAASTGQYVARDLFQSRSAAGVSTSTREPVPLPPGRPPTREREYRILLGIPSADQKTINLAPLNEMLEAGRVNIEVSGYTPTFEFGVGPVPVSIVVPAPAAGPGQPENFDQPLFRLDSSTTESIDPPARAAGRAGDYRNPPGVRFFTRFGRSGLQLPGRAPSAGDGPVGIYEFRGVSDIEARGGQVVLQTKIAVDRPGDLDANLGLTTSVAEVVVRNRQTKKDSDPVQVEPQTGRLIAVTVPAESVAGGDFDVLIRGRTPGQMLGLHGLTATLPSVTLVRAEHTFALNLFKALLVLWMLSILVVTIAVFCSTFLSWPIAVVLTLLLLLGRWGIEALGDSLAPGGSRSVAQDIFRIRDPSQSGAVTSTMEALSSVLRNAGPVLPDISRFPVFEDIDRGVSIPVPKVGAAGLQLVLYGLPLLMLTYFILRNKEVAP